MCSELKRRLTITVAWLFLAMAVLLPWFLSRQPTEAERRLAEVQASMIEHPPKLSDRSGYHTTHEDRQRAAVSLAAQKWYEELLEHYPEFKPEFKDVPDAQNGFLHLLALIEEIGSDPILPDDLRAMLKGESPWDPDRFLAWRSENQVLFDRILEIAELPGQSVKGIDIERYFFTSARIAVDFSLILNASGRAASAAGDPETALRFAKASINLGHHYDEIELPTLLAKTASIIVRQNTRENFTDHILPSIANDPDALATWREILACPNPLASEAPRLMKGEWNIMVRQYILPALLTGDNSAVFGPEPRSMPVPDPSEFFAAYSDQIRAIQQATISRPEIDIFIGPGVEPEIPAQLSEGSQEMLSNLAIGSTMWFKGMLESNSRAAMSDAALALLIGVEPPAEPITGRAFLWDPATRTLSQPAEYGDLGIELEPLTIP